MAEAEILPPLEHTNGGVAVDGRALPQVALTGGHIIDMLDEGNFSEEMQGKVRDLVADLTDLNKATGVKQKGKVAVTLEVEIEDGAFKIRPAIKVTTPERKRPRTVVWADEHNRLTRFPPNQGQLYGERKLRTI